jgi:hypothetical protein
MLTHTILLVLVLLPPPDPPVMVQCAAMDPSDTILAAGDVSGRILLWHDFPAAVRGAQLAAMGGAGQRSGSSGAAMPPVTTVHWHAHPVGALCFSSDSVYLLSGGQEGVLVSGRQRQQWSSRAKAPNRLVAVSLIGEVSMGALSVP